MSKYLVIVLCFILFPFELYGQSKVSTTKETLIVQHVPNPVHAVREENSNRPRWNYRTEVTNNSDIPIKITHFEIYFLTGGKWRPVNLKGRDLSTDDFIEWYDDGTSTCLRAVKMLAADDSLTHFAFDSTNYNTPAWHHLRIYANGTYVKTHVDKHLFSNTTDSDIATGALGIGYREYGGSSMTGGLVDSIIIDDNYYDYVNEVSDWHLY